MQALGMWSTGSPGWLWECPGELARAKVPTSPAVSTQSAVAETTLLPYINPSHQHFSWRLASAPIGAISCPYALVSSAVHIAMNRESGRQSSHLQDILVCSQSYWNKGV